MHAPRPSPSPLQAHLAALHGQPLDTVLHVGAGQGAVLHAYAERPPRRLLLVEGDPASAEALRGAARGRPWVEVVEAVVAPDAGTVSWQAYNLARFNGPPVIDGLEAVYPRLHRAGQSNVHATALPSMSLFQAPQKPPASGHRDLLVLDVPGQGAALLASLEPELVQRFHWVLVRACTLVDDDGAAAWQARMHASCYRPVQPAGYEPDPLWPWHLFELDAARWRIERLRRKVTSLQAQLAEAKASGGRLQHERDELRRQTQAESRQLAEANIKAKARLLAERDALAEQASDSARQLAAAQAERDELAQRVATLESRVAELTEQTVRQGLLEQALARAEAQLELVKSLLAGGAAR